jgi:hypothetical protein
MTIAATTLKVTGALGAFCLVLAAATLWVVFNEPVTVARVAYTGDLTPLLDLFSRALASLVQTAVRYL